VSDQQSNSSESKNLDAILFAYGAQCRIKSHEAIYNLPEYHEVKEYIQANYLSKKEVEAAIGDDDSYSELNNWDEGRNNLRSDIRQTLGLDTKKEGE